MRAGKSISRFAQLMRTNGRSFPGIASAYRAISLTALAWLVGLEAYQVREQNLHARGRYARATKTPTAEQAPPAPADASDNGGVRCGRAGRASRAGGQFVRQLRIYTTTKIGNPAAGSSTDPQLIAARRPAPAPVAASVVTTSPVPAPDVKTSPATVVVASPADFVPAAQGDPRRRRIAADRADGLVRSQHPALAST